MDNYSHRPQYMCHWSSSSISLIMPNYNRQHGYYSNQSWQGNNFDRRQVPEPRRFSQSSYNNYVNNPNLLYVLDGYSTKQALTQTSLNSIQRCNDPMVRPHQNGGGEVWHRSTRGRDQQIKRVGLR